jgi:hypothetical protein
MNKEIDKLKNKSMSDMVFTNLCLFDDAAFSPASQPLHPTTLLQIARCAACQHTPDTKAFWPTRQFLDSLFLEAARVVVAYLTQPDPRGPSTGVDVWDVNDSQLASLVWVPAFIKHNLQSIPLPFIHSEAVSSSSSSSMTLRSATAANPSETIIRMHTFAAPPVTADGQFVRDMELGSFWSEAQRPEAVFVMLMSRILHGFEYESWVLSKWPVVDAVACERFAPSGSLSALKNQLQAWLANECSIDAQDKFDETFKSAVYESHLPINTRLNAETRRRGASSTAVHDSTMLLQFELGLDVARDITNKCGKQVRAIAKDPAHPYFDLLMMQMFAYMMQQDEGVDFADTLLICDAQIRKHMTKLYTTEVFGHLRDPLIVRIARQWHIHWIDPSTKTGSWLRCVDAFEACLFWLIAVVNNHAGELNCAVNIADWAKQHIQLTPPDDEDVEL